MVVTSAETRPKMTIQEKLEECQLAAPEARFAINKNRNAIGAWVPAKSRFVPCLMLTLDGRWMFCGAELLVNGKPMISEWIE